MAAGAQSFRVRGPGGSGDRVLPRLLVTQHHTVPILAPIRIEADWLRIERQSDRGRAVNGAQFLDLSFQPVP